MERVIQVDAPGGGYPIAITPGALKSFDPEALGLNRRCAIVTNTTVAPLYGEALCARLPDAALIPVFDGEQYKNLDTVKQLYGAFIDAGLDRGSTVIALGGGVVGDTAGFAAATYMRGVRFVQMPTTLLSMVDSSVGGKVGVDLPQGKNLVGAFKQPGYVLIDPDVLATLPESERRGGMAEVIKHGLIADPELLDLLLTLDDAALVTRAIQVKVDIVQADPYENGVRAHLNLGHTFAHAIEQVSGYAWSHGAAVGVGLIAAARLSRELGMTDDATVERVERIVIEHGLPSRIGLDPDALYAAMATDKKWRGGKSRFVLLRAPGQVETVEGVPRDAVIRVLESLN